MKINIFLKLTFLLLAFLYILLPGCKPKTEVSVEIEPVSITAPPGDTVNYKIVLIPDALNGGELGEFYIYDSDSIELFNKEFSGDKSDSAKFDYVVPENAIINETIMLTFCAYDRNSNIQTCKNASITVGIDIPQIKVFSDVQAFFSSTDTANSMMFVLNEDDILLKGANCVNSDLAFVWDETYGYSIVSPDAQWIADIFAEEGINYSVDDKQESKMQKHDSVWTYFDQQTINDMEIVTHTLQGGDGNGVQNLNEGDILVFETNDGRKGVMKINVVTKLEKYLSVDVKYQKTSDN